MTWYACFYSGLLQKNKQTNKKQKNKNKKTKKVFT
jgi:hypothetical protein